MDFTHMEARQFIRHPVNLPIEASQLAAEAYCLGTGGLAFRCDHTAEPGTFLHVRIPSVTPEFEIDAKVVWCRCIDGNVELGVEFMNPNDAFRVRMVEQVCHIENYRQEIFTVQGREMTFEEAAMEWIGKFSATFPGAGELSVN